MSLPDPRLRTGFTVFLDRDGVFNRHPDVAVRKWQSMDWLPGVKEAFARLNRPDVRNVLCTNQPTVGLMITTPRMILAVHRHLRRELEAAGGRLHHIEAAFAPPGIRHRRRKPRPGMLIDATRVLGQRGWHVDKAQAVMVGDNLKDAAAGNAFGVPGILLATTHPRSTLEEGIRRHGLHAIVVDHLDAAVDEVLGRIRPAADTS